MPDNELWQIIAERLGVPGIALMILFFLFRRAKVKYPALPKKYVVVILVLQYVCVTTVVILALLLYKDVAYKSEDYVTPKLERTFFSLEESNFSKSIQTFQNVVSNATSLDFSADVTWIEEEQSPIARYSFLNHHDKKVMITEILFEVADFQKSKLVQIEPIILSPLAIYTIAVPTEIGTYRAILPSKIVLPAQAELALDIGFVVQSGLDLYDPSDLGSFEIRLCLMTSEDDIIESKTKIRL